MSVVRKGFPFKLASAESIADRGQFSGCALIYGEPDSLGDSIRKGCFARSIADAHGKFPCLWSHNPSEVLGTVTVEADTHQLSVTGVLLTDLIQRAREVHGLLKAKAVKGLSVGFAPVRVVPAEQSSGVEFIEGRLLEVSLTAVPAYASAEVHEVRAIADLAKRLDPERDRELLLELRSAIDGMLGGPERQEAEELARIINGIKIPSWSYRRG
jgi:HK97 family phage prohead protease